MNILNASSPVCTAAGGIDLVLETEEFGSIPFHALPTSPEDSDSYKLYQRAMRGEFGNIAPYEPLPASVPQIITARQGKLTLLDFGIYQNVLDYINNLSGDDAIRAKISWEAATEFNRNDPVLAAITQALSLTSEEIDQMFIHGASL